MIRPQVRLKGKTAFVKNCTRLNAKIQEAIRKTIIANAYEVEGDAKRMCPVITGRLRASLSVNWSGSPMPYGKVGANPCVKGKDGVGRPEFGWKAFYAAVGTNVEYAPPVEHRRGMLWNAYFLNVNWHRFSDRIKKAVEKVK